MFHYERVREKKRNNKYSIMFLNSQYMSGQFLSLKWNKKAKTCKYFLVTTIITVVNTMLKFTDDSWGKLQKETGKESPRE
jgi:hypothetical protein